jgi:polysaccharide export outer membrane protein
MKHFNPFTVEPAIQNLFHLVFDPWERACSRLRGDASKLAPTFSDWTPATMPGVRGTASPASIHQILRPIAWLRFLFAVCAGLIATAAFAAEKSAINPESTDYRIVPNDQIRFHITGEADETLFQRVSSEGQISVPLLGAVKVAGRTLRETETLMEKRYRDEGFFISPQIILSFESYASRTVSVLGQVNNPIQVEFPIERGQISIVNAITRAGGFTRVARTDAVKVMRIVEGKEVAFTVNVAAYLNENAKEQQVFKLRPDDVVFVPERVF